MKALELTVYPTLERPMWGHQIEGYRQQVKAEIELREVKRLTDAELAAEYWRAMERGMFVSAFTGFTVSSDSKTAMEAATLRRFATLPHYDEPQP